MNLGYSKRDINRAIQKAGSKNNNKTSIDYSATSKACLPYIQGVTDKMAKVLAKKKIRTSFKPLMTIKQRMKSVKDDPDHLQQKGVYKINCSCGDCYIGEIGRTFKIRFKELGADIRLGRIKTSALAEHSRKTCHHICLEEAVVISKEKHHFKCKIREAL